MINTRTRTETKTFTENLGNGTKKVTTKKSEVHYVTVGDIVGAVNNASDALKKLKQHASDINLRNSVVGALISPLLALASTVNAFKRVNKVMEKVAPIAQLAARVSGLFFSPGNAGDIAQIVLGTVEKIIIQLVTAGFICLKNWVWNHEFIIKVIDSEVSTIISVAIEDTADELLKELEEAITTITGPSDDGSTKKLKEELEGLNIYDTTPSEGGEEPETTDDDTKTVAKDKDGNPITTPSGKELRFYFAKKFIKDETEISLLGSAADEGLWYVESSEWKQSNIKTGNWKSASKFPINLNTPGYADGLRSDIYIAVAYPTWKLCQTDKFENTEACPKYGKITNGVVQYITGVNPVRFYKKANGLNGTLKIYDSIEKKFKDVQYDKYYYYDSSSNSIKQKDNSTFDGSTSYYTLCDYYDLVDANINPVEEHRWYNKSLLIDGKDSGKQLYYYDKEYKEVNKNNFKFSTSFYVEDEISIYNLSSNPKEDGLYRFKDSIVFDGKEYALANITDSNFNSEKSKLYERLNYRQLTDSIVSSAVTLDGYYEISQSGGSKVFVKTTDTSPVAGKAYFEKIENYEFFKTNDNTFFQKSNYYKLTSDMAITLDNLAPTQDSAPEAGANYFKYEAGTKRQATAADESSFNNKTKKFYAVVKTLKELTDEKYEGVTYSYSISTELTQDDSEAGQFIKTEGLSDNKKIIKYEVLNQDNFPKKGLKEIYVCKEIDGNKCFECVKNVMQSDFPDVNVKVIDIDSGKYYVKTYPKYATNLAAAAAEDTYFVENTDVYFNGVDDYYTDNTMFKFDEATGKVKIKDVLYEIDSNGSGIVYSIDNGKTWRDTNITTGNFSATQFVFDNTGLEVDSLEPYNYMAAYSSWADDKKPHMSTKIINGDDGTNYEIQVVDGYTPLTCPVQLYVDTGEMSDTGVKKYRKVTESDTFYVNPEENTGKWYEMVKHTFSYTPTSVAAAADNNGLLYSLDGRTFEKSNITEGSFLISDLKIIKNVSYNKVSEKTREPNIINDVDQPWSNGVTVE